MNDVRKSRPLSRFRLACRRAVLLAALAVSLVATPALAQEDEVKRDARLEGYAENVALDGDSTALTWLLLVFLGMVSLSVMFKNARRTHLD